MSNEHIVDAAADMRDWLILQHIRREDFSIGVGSKCLHVYLRFGRKNWPGERPADWQGIPITWHWNVGHTVALAS